MQIDAQSIIDRQIEAYNAHDLDRFLRFYAPEAAYLRHSDGAVLFGGQQAMREAYGELFHNHPAVHVAIANRITIGRFVIDLEHITGRTDIAVMEVVAIYEVADNLIQRVWVLR
jgi:hypothetical protein